MQRLSRLEPVSGTIKQDAHDFIVEEITESGVVLEAGKRYTNSDLNMESSPEGKFSVFVLQKTNWNTSQALREIARRLRRGIKSTAFAGTKDRTSVSTQLCSIYGVKSEELERVHIKDISVNGAWQSEKGVRMGDLLGNRFTISVRDVSDPQRIDDIAGELRGAFPNYFGSQRFGFRDNNVQIGVAILAGDFERAVMDFLTNTNLETNGESIAARKRLADERDFKAALDYFPRHLKYERLVIEHLSRIPTDFANAIRKLPRSLTLMFVHSVEAHIFNEELATRVKQGKTGPGGVDIVCNPDNFGFPDLSTVHSFEPDSDKESIPVARIVGYDTAELSNEEVALLDSMGLTRESFKVPSMPELNAKGSYRAMLAPFRDFSHAHEAGISKLGFSLPAGSYATVLMEEFIKG
ncbi:MAG: tRNA pseudouridine(13) synthase TruD [Candidatus Micrarchaeota archaeon]|nr:tRNA pseudouridine(13) synthase TruD [Candidatus Micrarchaeota archaeon]